MKKHFYTLLAFLHICTIIVAQEYALRYFNESNGLSHHQVTRALQDSTGMMWFSTYNGLSRFDGYRFVAFKAANEDGLSMSSDRIRRTELTENNNILCLIDDRIVLFNTYTYRFEALPQEQEEEALSWMQMKRKPDLWRGKEVYSTLGNLTFKNIRRDYLDRQGNHWLMDGHGLYEAIPLPARGARINEEEVRAMRQLSNGQILVSIRGTKQLAVYDSTLHLMGYMRPNGRISKQPVSFDAQVYSIYESRDSSRLWLGCKPGGLIEYSIQTAISDRDAVPLCREGVGSGRFGV